MLLVKNLIRYKCAKNCQNIAWFDKVIAKIWCSFFDSHGNPPAVTLSCQYATVVSKPQG